MGRQGTGLITIDNLNADVKIPVGQCQGFKCYAGSESVFFGVRSLLTDPSLHLCEQINTSVSC
jgi:hypothetical protein